MCPVSFPLPIVTGPEEALIGQAIASSYSYNTAHKVCHLARVDKGHTPLGLFDPHRFYMVI